MTDQQAGDHRYFEEIRKRLQIHPGEDLHFCKVRIGMWEPTAKNCFENVKFWVHYNRQYAPVDGWLVVREDLYLIAHSVVADSKTGTLFDITPPDIGGSWHNRKFVRHTDSVDFLPLRIRHPDFNGAVYQSTVEPRKR